MSVKLIYSKSSNADDEEEESNVSHTALDGEMRRDEERWREMER